MYNTTYWWRVKVIDQIGLMNTTVYNNPYKFTTAIEPKIDRVCRGMTCCGDDFDILQYLGFFGLFGLLALAIALKKNRENSI
jgi:hypothetical protein